MRTLNHAKVLKLGGFWGSAKEAQAGEYLGDQGLSRWAA
jgi:hypothetical protein